jgi:FMN phosphatase YigB (HAD superfamily)
MIGISSKMPDWRRDRALVPEAIGAARAVTLDVFDTLLFRRCGDPNALQVLAAAAAAEAGLFADRKDAAWYPAIRRHAQESARRSLAQGAGDITIEAIYRALPPSLGDLDRLMAAEWAQEQAEAAANPFLLSLLHELRERGIPVLLLSDMYWGEERITQLLDRAGIPRSLYRALFVSCDRPGSKADGRLFELARTALTPIAPEDILHIGDDSQADIAMPARLGFRTMHYVMGARERQRRDREAVLRVPPDGHARFTRRLAAQLAPAPALDDGFWFETGATILGPVLDGFVRWVLADCRDKGIRHIAPIMREGAIFARLMARHADTLGLDIEIRPVFLSRQALYLPALNRFDAAHLQRFAGASVYRTLDHLLARHFVAECPDHLAEYRNRTIVDLIGTPLGDGRSVFDAVAEILLEPGRVADIEAAAREQRALLLDYLDAEWRDCKRIATVDFGANGTMNMMLEELPGIGDRWRLENYFLYGTGSLAAKRARGMTAHVFTPIDEAALRRAESVNRCPLFLELLLNGTEATTLRYRRDAAGRVEPVTEVPIRDPGQQDRMRAAQHGIDAYVDLAAAAAPFDIDAAPDPHAPAHALGLLHRLVHLPTVEEARRLGDLTYDYNDEGMTRPIIDAAGRDEAAALRPLAPSYRVKMAILTRRAVLQWPEGALTLDDPDCIASVHLGANSDFGHDLVCRLLIARLAAAGENSVILCAAGGDGGMGPAFIALAAEAGIAIEAYLDYFADRVDRNFHGIPVLDGTPPPNRAFAIVSTGYGSGLEARLRTLMPVDDASRYYRTA